MAYALDQDDKYLGQIPVNTTYIEVDSTYGHDAFLLEIVGEKRLIKHFLDNKKPVKG